DGLIFDLLSIEMILHVISSDRAGRARYIGPHCRNSEFFWCFKAAAGTCSQQSVEILISNALVIEYEAVLTRPEHLLASRLTVEDIKELLDALCGVAKLVPIHQQ